MYMTFSRLVGRLLSMLPSKIPSKRARQRIRLRLERLESRELMCADLAELLPGVAGSMHFVPQADASAAASSGELVGHASRDLTTNSALSDSIGAIMGTTPASLGTFVPQTLSYSTLANGMPILHSLTGAPTALFLDFDGDTTTGTLAYDEDSNSTSFNTSERTNIAEAWRQMSIYFAPFNLDVTTVQPTVPTAWGAIGNNIVGGYSYVNVFPNTYPRSFNNSGDARTRVSGLAHEIGHNFGLSHQSDYDLLGNKTAEYSSGFDSLHGPIMGVDYAQSVHKWFIGHGAGSASTLQDDLAVISNRIKAYEPVGGDGFRADDFGGTIATATALTVGDGLQSSKGIVERMSDIDMFSFTTNGSPVVVDARPDAPSGIDIKLDIFDASGTLVAAADAATNNQRIALKLAAGTYYAQISSHGNYGDIGTYVLMVNNLPTGWTSQDVGSVGVTGYTQFNSTTGAYSIAGSGSDIWGTSDGAQLATQTLTGDGTITARVTSMTNTSNSAKSGLDIRETNAGNSKHVTMAMTYGNGPQMVTRSATGGSSTAVSSSAQPFAPKWLRLTRAGNVFTGFTSTDGVTWTQFATSTVTMASQVQIGLISGAVNNSRLNEAIIDNVTVTGTLGSSAPVYNALTAPSGVTVSPATGTGLSIGWIDGVGETGYRVERSTDGATFTTINNTAANATSFVDAGLTGSLRYFYRVSTLDATGVSTPSAVVSAVNRPSAVTNFAITSLNNTQTVLNWRDTHGETGFRVERSTDNVTFNTLATVGVNIPSYTDSGLTSGTTYYYRVTPTSALGDGVANTASGSTRLPVVTGQAFDSVASTQIIFHWNDIVGETSYRIQRSTDGTTYTTLTTVGAGITSYTDSTVTAANEYYYRVIGVNALTEGVLPTPIFTATPAVTTLPPLWSSTDIGSVNGAGATSHSTGTFKVISSGVDIWGTADAFRYTYQPLTGDGTITARVATQEATSGWSKVGVMIRESTAAGSRQALMAVTPSNGFAMQYRSNTNGSSSHIAGPTGTAPGWVRMVRSGNQFTGFSSTDGVTWTQVGSVSITMGANVLIGLEADANTSALLNTSTFDNVTVSNNAPTVSVVAAASPSTVTGNSTSLSVMGADDHGEANLTYTWSALNLPQGAASPTFSVNGTNGAKNSVANFTQAGTYTLLVSISDMGGLGVTSSVVVNVAQTLTTIAVSPVIATLNVGQTQQFTASGADQFGNAISSAPTVTWSVVGSGSISSSGLFSASGGAGSATVTASSGSISGSATVAVSGIDNPPTILNAPVASPSVITGNSTTLSVLGSDDGGEATLTYVWSIGSLPAIAPSPTFSVNNSNAAKNSTVTFYAAGSYTFGVKVYDSLGQFVSSSVSTTVVQTASSIALSPVNSSITGGSTQPFAAVVSDQFNQSLATQPAITWSAIGGGSIDAAGLFTAGDAAGSATVTATAGTLTNSTTISITNPAPTIVTPAAAASNPVATTSVGLSVLAADDRGESSVQYSWGVTSKPAGAADPLFGTNNSNAAKNTIATFNRAGSYTLRVTATDLGGATVNSSVNVSVIQTVTSIITSPATATVSVGQTQQVAATAYDQFGQALTTAPAFTWSVVSGGGTVSSSGLFTAPATIGTSVVRATVGSISGSSTFTISSVAPNAPTSLTAAKINRTVRLTWLDNAVNETGFYVQYSTNNTTWSNYTTVGAKTGTGSTTYTTGSLARGTYYFRILAFNASGISGATNSVKVRV
jgi:regulation of enolase protein 1 (concanavalin A-like superfamily)